MRHYCTLFDSKYLPQGLALYESLLKHSSEPFIFHVLPLDENATARLILIKMSNPKRYANLIVKAWEYFAALGADRTWQEYCWTCASQMSERILMDEEEITYLDADLFFFSDPEPVFKEIGPRSIAITPHRLIPSKKHLEVNGKYNVGFVHFKNSDNGQECLSVWAEAVRHKCSATEGCGDQKYLDDFLENYGDDVCELGIGVNVAPWNVANWQLSHSRFFQAPCVDGVPIVCYHFHEYIHGKRLTNYELREEDRDLIYAPYIEAVKKAIEGIAMFSGESQWETA